MSMSEMTAKSRSSSSTERALLLLPFFFFFYSLSLCFNQGQKIKTNKKDKERIENIKFKIFLEDFYFSKGSGSLF